MAFPSLFQTGLRTAVGAKGAMRREGNRGQHIRRQALIVTWCKSKGQGTAKGKGKKSAALSRHPR
jgi:hypothetical protein